MDTYIDKAKDILHSWFSKAPDWQKDLFCQIWSGEKSSQVLLDRAEKLIEQEYLNIRHNIRGESNFPENISFIEENSPPIFLESISNIKGVGALSANCPLVFRTGLTVVYGENGCGKSSYVRILKAAENPKFSDDVIGNVYDAKTSFPEATLTFSEDGNISEFQWTKKNTQHQPLQIYDSGIAHQFVDSANEVLYEPKILATISQIAQLLTELTAYYSAKKENIQNKYTKIPSEIAQSENITNFQRATDKSLTKIKQEVSWTIENQQQLDRVLDSLAQSDPQRLAMAIAAQKNIISNEFEKVKKYYSVICDNGVRTYIASQADQIATKKAADELTEDSIRHSLLCQFGKKEWKNMWSAASKYAHSTGVQSQTIEIVSNNRCALCQQPISDETLQRLTTFMKYVSSQSFQAAEQAHAKFEQIVEQVQYVQENTDICSIKTALTASQIGGDLSDSIIKTYSDILSRCAWLLNYKIGESSECPAINSMEDIIRVFNTVLHEMDLKIEGYQNVVSDKASQIELRNTLLGQKWIYENLDHKENELALTRIITKCRTNNITTLKKDLADVLITDTYIARFEAEMNALDSRHQIKVELVSKGAKKGRAYHQIGLKNTQQLGNRRAEEILSEGEYRVVSLAAFLADLSSWGKRMPFIFDDPITSLDHKFEERVARRLIKLSKERQVIVFTHRLAFANFLDNCASEFNASACEPNDKVNISHVKLRNFPLGQPSGTWFSGTGSIKKRANDMLTRDISLIKKMIKNEEYETADSLMQSLCSNIRNLVEESIELTLLSGIVRRFGRAVSTLKLSRLYAVENKDIEFIDSMMTKYSAYDHSQSQEIVVELPTVEAVETDLILFRDWATSFDKKAEKAEQSHKIKK